MRSAKKAVSPGGIARHCEQAGQWDMAALHYERSIMAAAEAGLDEELLELVARFKILHPSTSSKVTDRPGIFSITGLARVLV